MGYVSWVIREGCWGIGCTYAGNSASIWYGNLRYGFLVIQGFAVRFELLKSGVPVEPALANTTLLVR